LLGGISQLFIGMKHFNNKAALEALPQKMDLPIEKILERRSTEWKDAYIGLNVPKKN
jgi:hypothetical protein